MKVKKYQQHSLQRDLQLVAILVAILALLFGLYLVGIGIGPLTTAITFVAFLIFITPYIALGSPILVKIVKSDYESIKSLKTIALYSLIFIILANSYALLTNQFTAQFALYSVVWIGALFFVLTLFVQQQTPHILDYIMIALLWLPFEWGLLDQITIPAVQSVTNPLSLISLVLLIYAFIIIKGFDIGFTFRLKAEDYRVVILDFVVLFLVVIILGMLTGFLSIANYMPSFKDLLIQLGMIFFLVALPEELLFRGVLFTLLKKQFKGRKRAIGKAMLVSSVLFGLAHWNNPIGPRIELNLGAIALEIPWALILISTIAGLFYCFVFIRTTKVTAAAAIHLLVNWVYFAFFNRI